MLFYALVIALIVGASRHRRAGVAITDRAEPDADGGVAAANKDRYAR